MNRRSLTWAGITAIALAIALLLGDGWQSDRGATFAREFHLAQASVEDIPTLNTTPGPTLSGTYEDPQGNFQIGILAGYSVSSAGGAPLFQNADGSLAYSVVRVPLNSGNPLSDIGLVEVARRTLANGEGFQTQTFSAVAGGGLQIAWSGRLSQGGGPPQPVSGTILAKQQGADVYLMVVAALEAAAPQVSEMIALLSDTLTIL